MDRRRVWELLDLGRPGDRASRIVDWSLFVLILANVAAVVVGTVDWVSTRYGVWLDRFEVISVAVFVVEYLLRLWSCTTDTRYARTGGRLAWARTPLALFDLLAILPALFAPLGIDGRCLRIFRLLRIVRLVKAARYLSSLELVGEVLWDKREELVIGTFIMLLLLVLSSTLVYYAEHEAQPLKYADIPTTMWWAVATLTTVGYGDVYPVTPIGRVLASISAILGIGVFALPTGILGAGFVEAVERRRQPEIRCPHCGEPVATPGAPFRASRLGTHGAHRR